MKDMRVCLVNPPYRRSFLAPIPKKLEEASGKYPSLGLGYLAAMLEREGYAVDYVDMDALDMDHETFEGIVKRLSPDVVGVTTTSSTFGQAREVARIARLACPSSFIVIGGHHLSIYPTETLENHVFDAGIQGESDYAVVDLVRALEKRKRDLSKVPGLVYRDSSGRVVRNDPPPLVKDLDELPQPAYHLMPIKEYYCVVAVRHPFMTISSTRGCRYNCFFCYRPYGRLYRMRSPVKVVDEIEYLMKEYGVKEILFQDEEFTLERKHVMGICDEIRRRGLDVLWDCRSRVDTVDREMLANMKAAGCDRIHYGVESGDQATLNKLRKGIRLDQVRRTFALTKEIGITTLGYFMIGIPGETLETIRKTLEFSKELDPKYAQYAVTTAFPGTDLYDLAMKTGVVDGDVWRKYTLGELDTQPLPYFETREYTSDDLEKMINEAYRSFYLRPSYIMRRLVKVRTASELWHGMKGLAATLKV